MMLSQCVAATHGRLIGGDCRFDRISTDTRKIEAGDLFVALKGPNFDAHNFLQDAVKAGASGLVVEKPQQLAIPQLVVEDTTLGLGSIAAEKRRSFEGTLIAITGSSGKTSVKGMLAAILARCGRVRATQGNYNNHVGVPLTLMTINHSDVYAVVEMGTSSPGEIGYLAGLAKPQIALVNNIMPAHLEGFGSLAAIAQEKAQIYSQLESHGTAIINLNDRFAPTFIEKTQQSRQLGFYIDAPEANLSDCVSATQVEEDSLGRASFMMSYKDQRILVTLRVLGRHNVANALAAASCALAAGADLQAVAAGLGQYTGDKSRMQVVETERGVLIDDTYNANPGSVRAAIDYLAGRPATKVLVLGDLGELGEQAAQVVSELGDYARRAGINRLFAWGELVQHAAKTFGEGGETFSTQQELIEAVKPRLCEGAAILVKGSRFTRMENVIHALSRAGENP